MSLRKTISLVLSVSGLLVGAAAIANAQPQRTFAASFGNDANACITQTAPCRTAQSAHDKVAIEGEVFLLDGAGYGTITITKGVTIVGNAAASFTTNIPGIDAITVNVPPPAPGTRRVVLRDIRAQGRGMGRYGVNVIDVGTLYLHGVTVERFTTDGIHWSTSTQGRLIVTDTTSRDNNGAGLIVIANQRTRVSIDDSRFLRNGGDGVDLFSGNIDASIGDSTLSENEGDGLDVAGGAGAEVTVTRTTAASNGGDGFKVDDGTLNLHFSTAHRNGNHGMNLSYTGNLRVAVSTSNNNQGCGFNNADVGGTFSRNSFFMANMVAGNGAGDTCGTMTTLPSN